MRLPTRRWFEIAAALAVIGLLGLRWPEALGVLLLADAAWIAALLIDAWRADCDTTGAAGPVRPADRDNSLPVAPRPRPAAHRRGAGDLARRTR